MKYRIQSLRSITCTVLLPLAANLVLFTGCSDTTSSNKEYTSSDIATATANGKTAGASAQLATDQATKDAAVAKQKADDDQKAAEIAAAKAQARIDYQKELDDAAAKVASPAPVTANTSKPSP